MAEYINMQQDEYDELQTRLNQVHEDILIGESNIRRDIMLLMQKDGGMYVQNISYKISNLLYQMQVNVVENMSDCFRLSEQAIARFINEVIQSDIVNY